MYLSSKSFSVKAYSQTSQPLPLSCSIRHGSVLGPLLFILYTTPLSHLTESSSVDHHLYADDTQFLISFSPAFFQPTTWTPHLFFTSTIFTANHKTSYSSSSSVCHPRTFHSKLKFHLFKNLYPDSPDSLSSHSPPKLHPPLTPNVPHITIFKPDLSFPWTVLWTTPLIWCSTRE